MGLGPFSTNGRADHHQNDHANGGAQSFTLEKNLVKVIVMEHMLLIWTDVVESIL